MSENWIKQIEKQNQNLIKQNEDLRINNDKLIEQNARLTEVSFNLKEMAENSRSAATDLKNFLNSLNPNLSKPLNEKLDHLIQAPLPDISKTFKTCTKKPTLKSQILAW